MSAELAREAHESQQMKVYVEGNGAREACLRMLLSRTAEVVETPENADLLVVGPEVPLVAGFADEWRAKGKLVFGPGRDGAHLEGSKSYLKDFLRRAYVPTAAYATCTDVTSAIAFLKTMQPPYVIKTSGLAAGKGVLVTDSYNDAVADVRAKLSGHAFGDAGETVVIEEGLSGPEVSLFVVCDGKRFVVLPPAQDFKRVGENDQGPNTGGMGAYSPVAAMDDAMLQRCIDDIIAPTVAQLQRDGVDYRGTLYAGLMLTPEGPKILEYNVRFGDPDSQVSLLRYQGDVAELLHSAAAGALCCDDVIAPAHEYAAVNIVLAAKGYPERPELGDVITGVEDMGPDDDVWVFPAGAQTRSEDGALITSGGRVLNVAAIGETLYVARDKAYATAARIHFRGMHMRRDIALKAAEAQSMNDARRSGAHTSVDQQNGVHA